MLKIRINYPSPLEPIEAMFDNGLKRCVSSPPDEIRQCEGRVPDIEFQEIEVVAATQIGVLAL